MKLDKLKTFTQQLKNELLQEGVHHQHFYFFEGKWHDLESQKPVDETTSHALNRARKDPIAHHATSDLKAWFYFEESECGVSLLFPKSPKLITRKRLRILLSKVEESSSNAYKVSHNSITQLLAKNAFRTELEASIAAISKVTSASDVAQEIGVPRTLAVLALDIDHFKQVNDTWGHLYGDQVLRTFGMRLERTAKKIQSESIGNPTIVLGHPSGEEFLVLIEANATRQQFADWAITFCSDIAEHVLPTDTEWNQLANLGGHSELQPPPLHERVITASIGVALHGSISNVETTSVPSSFLLDRADTALYRAKAAGRNQVIFFDEILSSCGRILEIHEVTRVVAIDIGSNVGVSLGQEFKVFPPTFNGKKKFSINDGRTTRTLGTYPRVQSGRLVVFNTQPEVAFAYIDAPENEKIMLEVGAQLEAIPAGSIGHLLPSNSRYFPLQNDPLGGAGLKNLQEFVNVAAAEKSKPFAIVIRFSKENEYLKKYGTAALNAALARLYRSAQITFHAAKAIEVVDRGSICIAGTRTAYQEDMISSFVGDMATELPDLGLIAGIFCDRDYQEKPKTPDSALSPKNAIDFARFAASEIGRAPESRVQHFNHAFATKVLQALRESHSFETAYADFERLHELGVESAGFMNMGGLIAGSMGLRKEAAEHYAAAMKKDPDGLIYKSNFAIACSRLGDIESGLKTLNSVSLEDIDKLQSAHAFGYFTYARILAEAKLAKLPLYNENRFARIATIALSIPEFIDNQHALTIKQALGLQG